MFVSGPRHCIGLPAVQRAPCCLSAACSTLHAVRITCSVSWGCRALNPRLAHGVGSGAGLQACCRCAWWARTAYGAPFNANGEAGCASASTLCHRRRSRCLPTSVRCPTCHGSFAQAAGCCQGPAGYLQPGCTAPWQTSHGSSSSGSGSAHVHPLQMLPPDRRLRLGAAHASSSKRHSSRRASNPSSSSSGSQRRLSCPLQCGRQLCPPTPRPGRTRCCWWTSHR